MSSVALNLNSSKTDTGQIALHQARNSMAEHKADNEYNKNDCDIEDQLLQAAAMGKIGRLTSLLPRSSIRAINKALSVATTNRQIRAVKLILKFGGNPINDDTLSAPLYDAAAKCNVQMLTVFCQGFINVNAVSKVSSTRAIDYALESTRCYATEDERMNALIVLVSYGAVDWEAKALKMGLSPKDIDIINSTALRIIQTCLGNVLSLLYQISPLPKDLITMVVEGYLLPANYTELRNACRKSENADKEASSS